MSTDKRKSVRQFNLGDFPLQKGGSLKDAQISYLAFGTLNSNKDNVVLYPTHYSGDHESNLAMIGPDRVLSPEKYFIVIPNMFGNGVSTSPSNANTSQSNEKFPLVTVTDNVKAQRTLLSSELGIDKIHLVYGWSMGGQQAYQWATTYPDSVNKLAVSCSSPRTSIVNKIFLDMLRTVLATDKSFSDRNPSPHDGLRAFGRVYASWAYSEDFFRAKEFRKMGYDRFEDLFRSWEEDHLGWNAYDLLAMLDTWMHADISDTETHRRDLKAALKSIKAESLILPSRTDKYFPPGDTLQEQSYLEKHTYAEIPSSYGHMAGSPSKDGSERDFVERKLETLLTNRRA